IVKAIEGVEKVWTAENVAKELEQPLDREGDLAMVADKRTVIGGSEKDHDLRALKGKRLRTHGSLHEAMVPFILSEPLNAKYSNRAKDNTLRSREIFEYALNGTVA
ncbi:MAG: phosphonoacetate hydrolase, partial [SAR324 cluster bacterium]|nr:phosphonoacetate hydrolase [SAR324 cluster bacterium]